MEKTRYHVPSKPLFTLSLMPMSRFVWSFVFIVVATASLSVAQERRIPESQLPEEIRAFLDTHFRSQQVLRAEMERDGLEVIYEVYLSDGFELEFNRRREIIDITGESALPLSVLHPNIRTWLAANHPNAVVLEWERERRYQEIVLADGTEVKFDLQGNFLRYDD